MKTLIRNGLIVDGTGLPAFVGDIVVEGERIADVRVTGKAPDVDQTLNEDGYENAGLKGGECSRGRYYASKKIENAGLESGEGSRGRYYASKKIENAGLESGEGSRGRNIASREIDSSRLRDGVGPDVRSNDRAGINPENFQRVIDATGCLVTPGFIDSHTHSDAYLVIEPDDPSKITQGITTEINGQCGGSIAPRYGEARLSSDWAAILGDRLTWHSLGEYRDVLAQAKPAVNTVQFIGHNTLRSSVVGYAGRPATDEELEKMKYLLEEALEEGGYGFSTGLIYQPGKYATSEEVEELTRVVACQGGYYATHMRSESSRVLEAIDEVIDLVRRTGIRAEISHLKTSGKRNWPKIDAVLEKIEEAIDGGLLLGSDRYPFCAAGTDLDVVFPDWAGEGAVKGEMARLKDPVVRERIVNEINASGRDWSIVMIGGTWSDATRAYSGKTVADILAEQPGLTAGELVCSILEQDGCKTGAFFFGMSEDNLSKILSRPWIVPGSDASLRAPWGPLGKDHPHPRAYATMPEFYRRLRKLGVSREKAIARMTSVPAARFGLAGRGVLTSGAFADLVVWKEDEFKIQSTYTDPHRFTTGVRCVMVNGVVSYQDGKFTGDRAGRFLERG